MSENNQPKKRFKAGNIEVTAWENPGKDTADGKKTTFISFTMQRSYKDKEDNWKNTASFRGSDVPTLNLLLNKAFEWLKLDAKAEKA